MFILASKYFISASKWFILAWNCGPFAFKPQKEFIKKNTAFVLDNLKPKTVKMLRNDRFCCKMVDFSFKMIGFSFNMVDFSFKRVNFNCKMATLSLEMVVLSFQQVPRAEFGGKRCVALCPALIQKRYGSDHGKKAASTTEEENREGKQHERGRNEGKENDKNDVGTRAGGVKQPNEIKPRKNISVQQSRRP